MNCEICGRELKKTNYVKSHGMVLCHKHYGQILKYGHVLDNIPRHSFDLNEFEIHEEDNSAEIFLYDRIGNVISSFFIDLEDLDRVIVKKWRLWKNRVYTGNRKPVRICEFIMSDKEKGMVIDHKDNNPLNNRKGNLRITTQKNNVRNKSIQRDNHTGFAGIWYDNKREKYCAEIRYEDKKCFLGRYNDLSSAVYVRYLAEINLFKEYRFRGNDKDINTEIQILTPYEKDRLYNYVKARLLKMYDINIE